MLRRAAARSTVTCRAPAVTTAPASVRRSRRLPTHGLVEALELAELNRPLVARACNGAAEEPQADLGGQIDEIDRRRIQQGRAVARPRARAPRAPPERQIRSPLPHAAYAPASRARPCAVNPFTRERGHQRTQPRAGKARIVIARILAISDVGRPQRRNEARLGNGQQRTDNKYRLVSAHRKKRCRRHARKPRQTAAASETKKDGFCLVVERVRRERCDRIEIARRPASAGDSGQAAQLLASRSWVWPHASATVRCGTPSRRASRLTEAASAAASGRKP